LVWEDRRKLVAGPWSLATGWEAAGTETAVCPLQESRRNDL